MQFCTYTSIWKLGSKSLSPDVLHPESVCSAFYIELFDTSLCILILKTTPSPAFTSRYNNREQSHSLSVLSVKELRFGSGTSVNTTHHSVVNKDPVHLHSLIAFTVDRVNSYFQPIKI